MSVFLNVASTLKSHSATFRERAREISVPIEFKMMVFIKKNWLLLPKENKVQKLLDRRFMISVLRLNYFHSSNSSE